MSERFTLLRHCCDALRWRCCISVLSWNVLGSSSRTWPSPAGTEGSSSHEAGAERKRLGPWGCRRLGSEQQRAEGNPSQGGGHLSQGFQSLSRLRYPSRLHSQNTNSNIKLRVSRQQSQSINLHLNVLVKAHEASPNSYKNPRPLLTSEAYSEIGEQIVAWLLHKDNTWIHICSVFSFYRTKYK